MHEIETLRWGLFAVLELVRLPCAIANAQIALRVGKIMRSAQGDYRGAVLAAIRCGGDTDTVAAITGAIAGTGTGESGIPAKWLERLREWPRTIGWMRRLGERLARTRDSGIGEAAAPVSLPALLFRNVVFLGVVLTHGFHRLLQPY